MLVLPACLLAALLLLPLPGLSCMLLWFAGSILDLLFALLSWVNGMFGEQSVVSVNIANAHIVFLAAAVLLVGIWPEPLVPGSPEFAMKNRTANAANHGMVLATPP